MNRNNWFLVVPTVILGIVALVTVQRMFTSADVRKAVAVVRDFRAEGREPLGRILEREMSGARWRAEEVSGFYGTFDVICVPEAAEGPRYRWRVDVPQRAFAPADDPTRARMQRYAPEIFSSPNGLSSAPPVGESASAAGTRRGDGADAGDEGGGETAAGGDR